MNSAMIKREEKNMTRKVRGKELKGDEKLIRAGKKLEERKETRKEMRRIQETRQPIKISARRSKENEEKHKRKKD